MLADRMTALDAHLDMRAYANRMRSAADALLSNLSRDQLARALFPFEDEDERRDWDFIPKYRRKLLYGKRRRSVGRILRELCEQKGVGLLEGHAAADHIHLFLSIPPKYSVSYTVGFLKGKSAVRIHRELLRERRMTGLHFWATGYWVSTVGRDEEAVRKYIREQEGWDRQQGELFE